MFIHAKTKFQKAIVVPGPWLFPLCHFSSPCPCVEEKEKWNQSLCFSVSTFLSCPKTKHLCSRVVTAYLSNGTVCDTLWLCGQCVWKFSYRLTVWASVYMQPPWKLSTLFAFSSKLASMDVNSYTSVFVVFIWVNATKYSLSKVKGRCGSVLQTGRDGSPSHLSWLWWL